MVCGTMPYDDSNARQMVKEQLAHKIRFPPQAAYNLSASCKDLIGKLIEPNPEKRLTISGIQAHPWIANRIKSKAPVLPEPVAGSSSLGTEPSQETSTSNGPDDKSTSVILDDESRSKKKKNSTPEFWF